MPAAEYETRTDSVLAWKKAQKLGRFDPNAPTIEQQKVLASEREIEERGKQPVPLLPLLGPHSSSCLPQLLCAFAGVTLHLDHGVKQSRCAFSFAMERQTHHVRGCSNETAACGDSHRLDHESTLSEDTGCLVPQFPIETR